MELEEGLHAYDKVAGSARDSEIPHEKDLRTLRRTIHSLGNSLDQKTKEANRQRDVASGLRDQNLVLLKEAEQHRGVAADLRDRNTTLMTETDQYRIDVSDLQDKNTTLLNEADHHQKEAADMRDEIISLKAAVANLSPRDNGANSSDMDDSDN
jgi:chromosome segregation ATPase